MTETEIIKLVFGLFLGVGGGVLLLLAFTVGYRYLVMEQRCTCRTLYPSGPCKGPEFFAFGPGKGRAWGVGQGERLPKRCIKRMMRVMRNKQPNARAAAKEATHERIVSVAARAIRRHRLPRR